MLAEIYYDNFKKEYKFHKECLISEILNESGVNFTMPCGGKHLCKKCKVKIYGEISSPCENEIKYLSQNEINNGIRFACMTKALSDVKIYINNKIIKNICSDINIPLINKPMGKKLSLAIDIGTTTIATCIYDVNSKKILEKKCTSNPQRFFGDDVLTRLEKSLNNDQISLCIKNHLIDLISSYENHKDIDSVVISGNTAMLYILLNLNANEILNPPFIINHKFGKYFKNHDLKLPISNNAKIYIPSCISAYIGADTVSSLLSCNIPNDKIQLLIDMGTNGEIVLSNKNNLLCTSTAIGPAFEGIGITCGSVACDGAIENINFVNGTFQYKVIGNIPAKTICASGLIDLLSLMLKFNIIDKYGTINTNNNFDDLIETNNSQLYFTLPDTNIIITQSDIRSLQLAKSAIKTGIEVLLNEHKLTNENIDEIIIAGGFANHIKINNCVDIGLFPKITENKFKLKGNTSLSGSLKFLLDQNTVNKEKNTVDNAKAIDLNSISNFNEKFIDNINF